VNTKRAGFVSHRRHRERESADRHAVSTEKAHDNVFLPQVDHLTTHRPLIASVRFGTMCCVTDSQSFKSFSPASHGILINSVELQNILTKKKVGLGGHLGPSLVGVCVSRTHPTRTVVVPTFRLAINDSHYPMHAQIPTHLCSPKPNQNGWKPFCCKLFGSPCRCCTWCRSARKHHGQARL
jgi:hypothetical protein